MQPGWLGAVPSAWNRLLPGSNTTSMSVPSTTLEVCTWETLAAVGQRVGELLKDSGQTIAVSESATGGAPHLSTSSFPPVA